MCVCVCVLGCLSGSESDSNPFLCSRLSFLPSEAPLFYSLNVKRSGIKC